MTNISILGRVATVIEVKTTTNGNKILKFSVACNSGRDKTTFINCVAFNKTAEFIANYFKKGEPIALNGSLVNNDYVNKEGKTVKSLVVNVDNVSFVPRVTSQGKENDTVSDYVEISF